MWGQFRIQDVAAVVSAFVLAMALWVTALLVWQLRRSKHTRTLKRRLGAGEATAGMREIHLWRDGKEATALVPGLPPRLSLTARLTRLSHDAGWQASGQTLLLGALGGGVAVFLIVFMLSGSAMLAAATVVAGGLAFKTYLERCVSKRRELFDSQLIDGLELASRSLRAGHPLQASFQLISEEIDEPVGAIFANICQQQNLGLSLQDALHEVAEGSGSEDLKLFATSVVIQLRSGGNLADTMVRLANVMRDRTDLARHVRVLTSQIQLSKQVLMAVPFVLFVVINVVNADYMRPLYTTLIGKILLGIGAAGLIGGALVMKKLAVLKY